MSATTQSPAVDIVQLLKELPEPSHEEVMADICRLQDGYERGLVDMAGRPINVAVGAAKVS